MVMVCVLMNVVGMLIRRCCLLACEGYLGHENCTAQRRAEEDRSCGTTRSEVMVYVN